MARHVIVLPAEAGYVAHLSPWPRLALAVPVQSRLVSAAGHSDRAEAMQVAHAGVPQQVAHHGDPALAHVSERQAGHGAQVLFELRRGARLEGVVAGVVHAWRDLVDQQLRVMA